VRRAALAFLAGAVSVAGFGDWSLFPLPIIATAVLFWLWAKEPSLRAATWLGFSFGAGLFLVGVSWVYVSLHQFGMMPAPLAGIATLIFCLYLALFPTAVGYAQAKLAITGAARLILVVPALWALAEWVRSWLFTGVPWLTLGYSQIDGPLAGYAPILGVFGVSLATAATAGAIVALVTTGRHARIVAAVTILVLVAVGYALRAIDWTAPFGDPLTVSLLQGNVPQDLKFQEQRYDATLATYARLVESSDARLIVLPEVAIPRFLGQVDPAYLDRLAKHAAARDGDVLVGVPLLDSEGRYYNAVISLGTSPTQGYAKTHLVPFGEFLPPGFGWVVTVLKIPLGEFSRGPEPQRPLAVAGERVAINICYEDAFGEEIIRQLPEATLLVNVSNVAWFGDSLAPSQHLRIARTRSLETGRTMLNATNTGITAIVDPRGSVVARIPSFTEGALRGTVQGRTGATPYSVTGNYPTVLVCFAATLAAFAVAFRRERIRRRAGVSSQAQT
jgi:apolipoprotein N-acyltransferase